MTIHNRTILRQGRQSQCRSVRSTNTAPATSCATIAIGRGSARRSQAQLQDQEGCDGLGGGLPAPDGGHVGHDPQHLLRAPQEGYRQEGPSPPSAANGSSSKPKSSPTWTRRSSPTSRRWTHSAGGRHPVRNHLQQSRLQGVLPAHHRQPAIGDAQPRRALLQPPKLSHERYRQGSFANLPMSRRGHRRYRPTSCPPSLRAAIRLGNACGPTRFRLCISAWRSPASARISRRGTCRRRGFGGGSPFSAARWRCPP